jgi:dynactin 4
VDANKYFCSSCFDNKTQKEACAIKYKCSTCYNCPTCKNSLIIRASSGTAAQKAQQKTQNKAGATPITPTPTPTSASLMVSQSSPTLVLQQQPQVQPTSTDSTQQQQQSQKYFYLLCGFCRWTTREAGIPDSTTPSGWKLPDNEHAKRITELLDAYKVLAAREKLEKERKKYTIGGKRRIFHTSSAVLSTGSNLSSLDRYGILTPVHKKFNINTTHHSEQGAQQTIEQLFKSLVKPAIPVESFDPLPDDILTKPINVNMSKFIKISSFS